MVRVPGHLSSIELDFPEDAVSARPADGRIPRGVPEREIRALPSTGVAERLTQPARGAEAKSVEPIVIGEPGHGKITRSSAPRGDRFRPARKRWFAVTAKRRPKEMDR
jgi:hypothetical protein